MNLKLKLQEKILTPVIKLGSKAKLKKAYLLLIIFSLLLAFSIIEIFLRIIGTKTDPVLNCREQDMELHHKLKPNSNCRSKTPEWNIEYRINSFGLRDDEIEEKQTNELRILVLGDSFTEGMGMETKNRFTEILEEELAKKTNRKINVINAGIASYSPVLELEFFRKNFNKLNPDLVIVALDMTDFKDEIGYYNFLREKASVDKKELGSSDEYISTVGDLNKRQAQIQTFKEETRWQKNEKLPLQTKIKFFLRHSKFYVFVTNAIKNLLNKPYLAYGSPPFIEGDIETDIFAVVRDNLDEQVYQDLWRLPKKSFTEFSSYSKQMGFDLMFLTYPHAMQVDGKQWSKGRLTRGFVRGKTYSARPLEDFVEFGKKLNVPTLNLLEDFRGENAKKLYFDEDGHFTDLAHQITGKKIAGFIVESNLID